MCKETNIQKQQAVLTELIETHDFSREFIASEIGVTRASLSHWITGRYEANEKNTKKLEGLLNKVENADWQDIVNKLLRETAFDTYEKLGNEIGVHYTTVGHWARGRRPNKQSKADLLDMLGAIQPTEAAVDTEGEMSVPSVYSISATVSKSERDQVHKEADAKNMTVCELVREKLFRKTAFEKLKSLFR